MVHVVSFPGLGLEFTLNRVAFEIFGRPVYWYGIIIACGLLLAVYLCSKWAPRFGVVPDHILDLMIFAAALIAIRAYYVIFNLDLYKNVDGSLNWEAIFRYSDGGLAIYGAIISSAIVLLIFCHVRKVSFLAFADLGVHGLFIGQLIGRWGNFMNVEAYGGVTDLPWRMCSESIAQDMLAQGYVDQAGFQAILDGTLGVHPTFFYESAWNLIEGLRTDSLYFFGLELFGVPIRVSQMVAAVCFVAAGAILLYNRFRPHDPAKLYVNRLKAQAEQKFDDKSDNKEE